MPEEIELTSEEAEQDSLAGVDGMGEPFDRRKFIGGLVTATAGVAGFVGPGNALAALRAPKARHGTADGPIQRIGPRLGKDGLPVGSVAGTLIATTGDGILISADAPTKIVVRVALTPYTIVTAHGTRVLGDASPCKVGDFLNVGTDFDSKGQRVANWVVANLYAGMAWVVTATDAAVTFVPDYSGSGGDEQYTAMIASFTVVDFPGRGNRASALRRDDYIHFTGIMESPTPDTSVPMWAGAIH